MLSEVPAHTVHAKKTWYMEISIGAIEADWSSVDHREFIILAKVRR